MYNTSSSPCYSCEAHLAAAAAQPITALGALSQGAPVATVLPFLGTLLDEKDRIHSTSNSVGPLLLERLLKLR